MADIYTTVIREQYWDQFVNSNTVYEAEIGSGSYAVTLWGGTFAAFWPTIVVTMPSVFFFTGTDGGDGGGGEDPGGEDPTIYSNCVTGDEGDVDMEMFRGNKFTFDCFVRNQLTRDRVSLVGGLMIMTAKWNVADADADAVFQLRSTDTNPTTIEFTNPAQGEATVSIPPSATSGLPADRCILNYDLKFIDVDDNPYTVANGLLVVYPGVTVSNV